MRKIYFGLFVILIMPLFFPTFVKAENTLTKAQVEQYCNDYYSENISFTDNSITALNNMVASFSDGYKYILYLNDNRYWVYSTTYSVSNYSDTYWKLNSGARHIVSDQNNTNITLDSTQILFKKETTVLFNNVDEFLAFFQPTINFDDIYYSAQIPVPDIDVFMNPTSEVPEANEAVWNASVELEDNSNYYIQWGIKISYPTYITVGLGSLNGDFIYNYYSYLNGVYADVVSMQSLTTAVAQGATSQNFLDGWVTIYGIMLNQPPEFSKAVNAMSDTMLNNAATYYKEYMMSQMPMYGNRLEIFARYFLIDSENDNRVVVGPWNHWSSKDGSKTKERPSNYIDNVALPGYISTNNDTTYQDNQDTYSSSGETTGTPATIINNNYAPNYPDYPTVATYNHDNILLNFMDTARQLPSFFGDFTGFLTVAFGFIPSWIWAIVGAGFTFSIVIMIIKVL